MLGLKSPKAKNRVLSEVEAPGIGLTKVESVPAAEKPELPTGTALVPIPAVLEVPVPLLTPPETSRSMGRLVRATGESPWSALKIRLTGLKEDRRRSENFSESREHE